MGKKSKTITPDPLNTVNFGTDGDWVLISSRTNKLQTVETWAMSHGRGGVSMNLHTEKLNPEVPTMPSFDTYVISDTAWFVPGGRIIEERNAAKQIINRRVETV